MIASQMGSRTHRGRWCGVCQGIVPPDLRCVCEMGAEQEALDAALVETCHPTDRAQSVMDAAGATMPGRMSITEIVTIVVLVALVVLIFASGPRAVDQTMARQEQQSRMGQEVQFDRP